MTNINFLFSLYYIIKQMSNYVVAIPSYKRSESIGDKTLRVLTEHGISPSKIFIFVANKSEEKDYKENVNKKLYKDLVVGVKGLRDQRNFITKYYPEGKHIVELDDDVEEISQLVEGKTKEESKLKEVTDLDAFFKDAFSKCKQHGAHLWGVYPVYNAFFMSKKINNDLRFVVGPLWGKINRHDKRFKLELNEKEDVERTLRNYDADKTVIRFNDIVIKTKYYKTPGGMQYEKKNRHKEALKSAKYLIKEYPNYTTLWLGKKSEHPEVKLKDKNDTKKKEERYQINKKKYYTKKKTKRKGGSNKTRRRRTRKN